ncbi:hypothetical protein ABS71_04750 [bacterium SCN 62-11]|nr:MAG: hypothetical protein ABS71_04750 [bacterium SCN 62-11]
METSVTLPLERRLATFPGLLHTRSMSMHEISVVVLEFPYGQDAARHLPQVAAVLPPGSRVVAYDPLNLPVLSLAVHAQGEDSLRFRQLLEKEGLEAFRGVPGVERVSLFGPRTQLEVALRSQVAGAPLGKPDQLRLDPQQLEELERSLRDLPDLEELARRQWGERPFLEAVAVRQGPGHDSPRYRYNGHDAFEINIFQNARASSPALVSALRAQVRLLQKAHPELVIEEAYNNAHFVEVVQANVWLELLLAIGATGGVVWLFLGEVRGTLIALATIPAALALTLVSFVPLGLSLNSTSLIGLLLALGRLVDDTIIDLHAVASQRALGKGPCEAAVDGCSEVRPAVVSSTLVLALAILPLTWCGGLTQDMFVGILWPFLLSLGASLVVSLTLTPVLASLFYRGGGVGRRWENLYRGWLRTALGAGPLILGMALAASYLSWMMVPMIGSEMMPLADTGLLYVEMEGQPNSSTQETARLAAGVEEVLRRCPEVVGVSCEVGMDAQAAGLTGYDLGGPHSARMLVTLRDRNQRRRDLWAIADDVYARALHDVPGIRRLLLKEMGSDVMASAMTPVELVLSGPNLKRLSWLAEQTRDLGRQIRGLHMVSTSWSPGRAPRVLFRPPGGPGKVLGETRQGVRLVLQDGKPWPDDLAQIEHQDQQRSISVSGVLRRGGPGSMRLSMDLQMASQSQLPYPAGYRAVQRGEMLAMMDSFDRLLTGLMVAIGLIYGSLVLWFRDWRLPLVLLLTIPLELAGVLTALVLTGQTFSSVFLLGLVVLHGMDMTAGILLLDRVEGLRRSGLTAREALLEGAPQRVRPILMTVAITLAVMLPLALFPRTGMDAYAPLATVIVGGLSVSALLTLFVIPALYSLLFTRSGIPGLANAWREGEGEC